MNFILISLISLFIFGNPVVDKKPVDTAKSAIEWEGRKVGGKHNGTISIKEGALEFDGLQLVGGSFIVDMTTITVTDLQGGIADRLRGHLASDDFFGVEQHPEAILTITSATLKGASYDIKADLTIKGVTEAIEFNATLQGGAAKASIEIDRTKYNLKYRSGKFFEALGDKLIYDDFTLNVSLVY